MRRAAVTVSIKGHDVTLDLMPYLVSLTYTDKADEELDDLRIVLEDREGIWQGDWLPQTGDVIEASILTENWREIGAVEELPCGKFEVDEMELESSAEGGDTVTVKAVPAAVKSSLMLQKKTRSWEKTPITTVIADIAGAAGLDTLYRGPELVYERVEQRQESDLEFMQRITKEQGLRLAVKSDRVVVYAGQTADQLEPIAIRRASEADPGEGLDFQSFRAKRTTEGIYTQCVVGYTKAADSETIETQYEPNIPPTTGRVLYINKRIENQAQAERMAKAELRDKNRKEQTASLSGMGDTRFRAGTVLDIQGWGRFDSKYVIAQATHTFSADGGYTTSLELEKALDYDEPDMNCISAKTMAISERRWLSLLAMLAGENYIEVVCARESVGRKTVTSVSSVRLTLRGLEYLQEKPTMKRAEAIEKKASGKIIRKPDSPPPAARTGYQKMGAAAGTHIY